MSQGSVFNCKNHPMMRWFNTKPNGSLVFMGEITEDGKLKEGIAPDPLGTLRSLINGRNPYAPDLMLKTPITWEFVVEFVQGKEAMKAKGYVYECSCPWGSLEILPNETYESVRTHPYYRDDMPGLMDDSGKEESK